MRRWISILLLIMGLMDCSHAETYDEPLSEENYTQAFWKVYTDALRGDSVAQFQIGVMYERGLWVEKNETLAVKWYEKAAHQGHIDAQYNIGIMYASGRGVKQNDGLAMMWLALAAKQGDAESRKLVLAIIDGKTDTDKHEEKKEKISPVTGEMQEIHPVRLLTKEGAKVCTGAGACTVYKANTTLTSKSKRGEYYKISGIGMKRGWEPFDKEGWVAESDVEVRR